jgi:hypothetical protein
MPCRAVPLHLLDCSRVARFLQARLWAGRGRAALVRKALAKMLANALAQA